MVLKEYLMNEEQNSDGENAVPKTCQCGGLRILLGFKVTSGAS